MLKKLYSSVRHRGMIPSRLFGGACFLCRGASHELLCAACDTDLPRLRAPACPRCALASPGGALCGRCLAQPPAYDATLAALDYRFPADVLIHALKFRGELALAPFLGDLLSKCISGEKVDCLIPVPLSRAKLRERGYNQAVELARTLSVCDPYGGDYRENSEGKGYEKFYEDLPSH